MSSSSNKSGSSSSEESANEVENIAIVYGKYEPYLHEPLARKVNEKNADHGLADGHDGLSPDILAQRFQKNIGCQDWCVCQNCSTEKLVGSLEYRCCREVLDMAGKMAFDGSIEHIKCITQHEDFLAITNRAVLNLTGQALKRIDGSCYRRKKNIPEDEYLRAVAYRLLIKWLCGYMGWSNTRPLSACIYNYLRTKYSEGKAEGHVNCGYLASQSR